MEVQTWRAALQRAAHESTAQGRRRPSKAATSNAATTAATARQPRQQGRPNQHSVREPQGDPKFGSPGLAAQPLPRHHHTRQPTTDIKYAHGQQRDRGGHEHHHRFHAEDNDTEP